MSHNFAGKRVTVMGLGRFGGGVGIARWLVKQGADVLVTDVQSVDQLREPLETIQDLRDCITLHLGGHRQEDFSQTDLVIANPAVSQPWDNVYLNAALHAGVPITTEIRLVIERLNRNRVIGVTGSAGKSTTSAMIHHILQCCSQSVRLGGNIGGSLLDDMANIAEDDWVVLELSSFMLHWLGEGVGFTGAKGWSPHVALLTNIEANHLDWHGSFEHYEQSKLNIFRYQEPDDIAVKDSDVEVRAVVLKVPGRHNQVNASFAMHAVERATGIDFESSALALATFHGLPHRLALIAETDGRRFYDDSKSTTPAATLLAVQAFEHAERVHLIAGGYDKGSDLSPIAALAPRLGGLYTIGSTGLRLAQDPTAVYCNTLDIAVASAMTRMKPGDMLLLSPGCASWDQFTNYEERGKAFTDAVRKCCNIDH